MIESRYCLEPNPGHPVAFCSRSEDHPGFHDDGAVQWSAGFWCARCRARHDKAVRINGFPVAVCLR